jgi:hypothetical protein
MQRLPALYPAVIAVLLGTGALARADLVQWSYTWTPGSPTIAAGTGGVTFTKEGLPGSPINVVGSSDIVATNLTVFSSADPNGTPDKLPTGGSPYSLNLTLTDKGTGQSQAMTFTGVLSGTFSSGNAEVGNTFTGQLTQTWTASNGDVFTVSISPNAYVHPGPPKSTDVGSIGAHVDVQAGSHGGGGGGGGNNPEPSTLILAGFGGLSLGTACWARRRRGKLPAAAAA